MNPHRSICDQKPVLAMPRADLIQVGDHLVAPIGTLNPFLSGIQGLLPLGPFPGTSLHDPIATVKSGVLILDVGPETCQPSVSSQAYQVPQI